MNDLSFIEPSWQKVLAEEFQKPYMLSLREFVKRERESGNLVYPPSKYVFSAFWETPYDAVKVVIVGQDPYHGPNQAHGLSFSVLPGVPSPPSLQNIFKELNDDLKIPFPSHGCLNAWAKQGVMLLNATLTVRQGTPMSHHGMGWEQFTDVVISKLAERKDPIIFVLWGKSAQEKVAHLTTRSHVFLLAPHPSPFSANRGFFGCRHFSKINALLTGWGKTPIQWEI